MSNSSHRFRGDKAVARSCILSKGPFDPLLQLIDLTDSPEGAGAVASFTGIARPESKTGEKISAMFLDHHPRLTIRSIRDIAEEAEKRFAVKRIRVVHRCGKIMAGEPIVFVAAAAAHRRAALDAVDYMMDRLKTDAIFWKREDGPHGGDWIEPTDADHAARARWE